MPSILARLQMILAMAPTFISDKRRCRASTGIHSRHERETGRKVGCDVSILTSFISQKYYARYIHLRAHLFITLIAVRPPHHPRYDVPQTVSASRYIYILRPSLQLRIIIFFRMKTCLKHHHSIFDRVQK